MSSQDTRTTTASRAASRVPKEDTAGTLSMVSSKATITNMPKAGTMATTRVGTIRSMVCSVLCISCS